MFAKTVCDAVNSTPPPTTLVATPLQIMRGTVETKSPDESNLFVTARVPIIAIFAVGGMGIGTTVIIYFGQRYVSEIIAKCSVM